LRVDKVKGGFCPPCIISLEPSLFTKGGINYSISGVITCVRDELDDGATYGGEILHANLRGAWGDMGWV